MARIDDGHSTIIQHALGGVTFWEKEVTPPGFDSGGPNDTTTMRNIRWRTRAPKHLITLTEMTLKVAYDPDAYDTGAILNIIGVNDQFVVQFPDGETVTFYGWLDKFIPDPIREGEQPTATITIQPSNQDGLGVETAPVFAAA